MKLIHHFTELVRYVPGKVGDKLRYFFYSFSLEHLGKNVEIKDGVVMLNMEKISIGSYSGINQQCYLNAYGGIQIGNHVRIAPHAALISTNHRFDRVDIPISLQPESPAKIIIEDDVWIGYGSVVLKGVRIGKGSVIGANAIVRKDIPPYSIVVGESQIVRRRK